MEKKILFIMAFISIIFIKGCIQNKNKKEKENLNTMDYKVKNINFEKFNENLIAVAIIGTGPAGCSAALKSSRMGLRTAVFGIGEGQLGTTGFVENIPGVPTLRGNEIIKNMKDQAAKYGALFIEEIIESIDEKAWPFKIKLTNGNIFYALSIIITTGSSSKKLNVKGEEKYWSKGVTTCAICDGPLYKDKNVIVVGGGDSACEEALQLVDAKVKSIKMLVRTNKMRASDIMQKRVEKSEKIEILYNTQIKEIVGNESNVTSVLLDINENNNIKSFEMPIDGIFIAIGHTPNTLLVENILNLDENKNIICINRSQETSFPGFFAAGDVCNNYRQADISIGEGGKAAIDAYNFIQKCGYSASYLSENKKAWIKKNKEEESISITCENGVCYINKEKEEKKEKENLKIKPEIKKSKKVIDLNSIKELDSLFSKNLIDEYIILDIYTTYCPSCTRLKTTLNKYLEENNNLEIYSINIDKDRNSIERFPTNSVPYVLILKKDKKSKYGYKIISTKIGYLSIEELKKWINKNII